MTHRSKRHTKAPLPPLQEHLDMARLEAVLRALPPERAAAFLTELEAMSQGEAGPRTEQHLTPEAAAARLSVSPRAVREWIRQGKLRAMRVAGKLLRVPESALADILSPVTPAPASDQGEGSHGTDA